MNRSILLLCLLTSGCGMSPVWHVDTRFSPEEQQEIQRAADTWTTPIDLVFDQHVSAFDTDRKVIVRVDRTVMEVASELARGNPQIRTVLVDNRILVLPESPWPMWYRVAHELGHGLGIEEHVADPSALMYHTAHAESLGCVTPADVDAYLNATGERIRVGCAQ